MGERVLEISDAVTQVDRRVMFKRDACVSQDYCIKLEWDGDGRERGAGWGIEQYSISSQSRGHTYRRTHTTVVSPLNCFQTLTPQTYVLTHTSCTPRPPIPKWTITKAANKQSFFPVTHAQYHSILLHSLLPSAHHLCFSSQELRCNLVSKKLLFLQQIIRNNFNRYCLD